MSHTVLLFYKYVTIADPELLRLEVLSRATELSLHGRVLIAQEGINATLEGSPKNADAFATFILSIPEFSDIKIKTSSGKGDAFPKLSVKVRPQIVGTRFSLEDANPREKTAPRITAKELREWYESGKEFEIVDMRNDYEYASGHFKNSINPGLENSRDLPQVLPKLEALKEKTVLTVCTGGIRCESMSAYLMNKGFENVYQLDNGIHGYMEEFPGKDFEGTLYTFDQRLTMDFGGDRSVVGACHRCTTKTEKYVNCLNLACHYHFLVCEACVNEQGEAFCSDKCMNSLVPST